MTGPADRSARAKALARAAGFELARVAPAIQMEPERSRFVSWIEEERQADMAWITPERAERASDPRSTLANARSVLCVALSYWAGHRPPGGPHTGRIARYAWGRDYHAVMGERLRSLAAQLEAEFGGEHRWYVDTGPLMDRALAARAGLGWVGKNSNILTEALGSFVLLGEIVTTLELAPDRPLERSCGQCRLCVVACPTGAIDPEYRIDSGKCISYLTIEHRGSVPIELRSKMGDWVFGCDICQDVCPPTVQPHLRTKTERRSWAEETRGRLSGTDFVSTGPPGTAPPREVSTHPLFEDGTMPFADLFWLLNLSHEDYVERFRGTAIKRAKVWMLRRNAAIALGNVGDQTAVPHLARALCSEENPIVRGHVAWALGRLGNRTGVAECRSVLLRALEGEHDVQVAQEIQLALTMTEPDCSILERRTKEESHGQG